MQLEVGVNYAFAGRFCRIAWLKKRTTKTAKTAKQNVRWGGGQERIPPIESFMDDRQLQFFAVFAVFVVLFLC
jgi:hypothetical protein